MRNARLFALFFAITVVATPAAAQFEVFDPTNYAQNVITAANTLTQINNQIQGLQNQALSLANQARNLTSLPYSALSQLQASIAQTQSLVAQAQGVAYDVNAINQAFQGPFGAAGAGQTQDVLYADAETRWQDAVSGFEDAMKTQATVLANLPGTHTAMDNIVSASQGADGALQAAQAGNQLLALQSQQLSDITSLLAAQGRAQALDAARAAADESAARENFKRFTAPSTYAPRPVQMYGQ